MYILAQVRCKMRVKLFSIKVHVEGPQRTEIMWQKENSENGPNVN